MLPGEPGCKRFPGSCSGFVLRDRSPGSCSGSVPAASVARVGRRAFALRPFAPSSSWTMTTSSTAGRHALRLNVSRVHLRTPPRIQPQTPSIYCPQPSVGGSIYYWFGAGSGGGSVWFSIACLTSLNRCFVAATICIFVFSFVFLFSVWLVCRQPGDLDEVRRLARRRASAIAYLTAGADDDTSIVAISSPPVPVLSGRNPLAQYWRPHTREQYEALSHEDLVDLLTQKDVSLRWMRNALRPHNLLPYQIPTVCTGDGKDDGDDGGRDDSSWELVYRGGTSNIVARKSLHLTPRSAMVVAMRRNLSNVAASSFGCCALADISRQTVVRCELTAGASLVAAFRFYHSYTESTMANLPASTCQNHTFVSCHSISSDATNSAVWRRSKLQGLHLLSSYLANPASTLAKPFSQCVISYDSFADIQRVVHSSAGGTLALILKQLASLGCPLWREHGDMKPGATVLEHGNRILRLVFYTSDGGPDQCKFKQVLVTDAMLNPLVITICSPCFMHCVQLVIRSGLVCADRWCLGPRSFDVCQMWALRFNRMTRL